MELTSEFETRELNSDLVIFNYNDDTDVFYILFIPESKTCEMAPTPNGDIKEFIRDHKLVGYLINNVHKNMRYIFKKLQFSKKEKLALALRVLRGKQLVLDFSKSLDIDSITYHKAETAQDFNDSVALEIFTKRIKDTFKFKMEV